MADYESLVYPKVMRNTVHRLKARAKYDFTTIHTIVNTSPILHVSFSTSDESDPFTAVLPMLGFMGTFNNPTASLSEPLDLYLHGYISSRLMRLGKTPPYGDEEGLPLTVAATHLDGLVLALTPNHHSYNYRSAILHGFAVAVEDTEEKLWAMEKITNNVVTDRWQNTRVPPTKTEMTSTQILRVRIVDASAKVREGPPGDDRADMKNEELRAKTWVGVVPTYITFGEPIASLENRLNEVPQYITDYVEEQNTVGRKTAEDAVVGSK